ncbi:MAG: hypothetical protein ACI8QZ_002186 [Chlamydiales bacterium]|jgi:uncharacterized protein (TIGR00290 family)
MTGARPRVLLSWSSGKDSAWSLHVLRTQGEFEVVGLLTSVNQTHERVAMHAVRRALLHEQAAAVGLPVREVSIPHPCSNEIYEREMRAAMDWARGADIAAVAFGDLFLEDIRAYREERMADTGLEAIFPLWERPTPELAGQMLDAGVCATITCVDPRQAPADLAGRAWDRQLIDGLPDSVDPCGENGEFHTFVTDGPMFERPLSVERGEVVERDGFVFADLVPSTYPSAASPDSATRG